MSRPKRLYLYLSAQGMHVLQGHQSLRPGPFFAHANPGSSNNQEPHIDAAAAWLDEHRHAECALILDLAEETFGEESIPEMGRQDTRAFVQRRLAQRFRDAQLFQWSIPKGPGLRALLGTKKADRRTRVAISVVNKTDPLSHWLRRIDEQGMALHSITSPSLLALRWVRHHLQMARALVVSWAPGGLRQTAIHNGEIVFSRLTPINDPVRVDTIRHECARTISYLLMAKQIQRADCEQGHLPICVLEGGITNWDELPEQMTLDSGLSLPVRRIVALADQKPLFHVYGSLPIWCQGVHMRPVAGSPARGYATRAMTHIGTMRHLERSMRWSGLAGVVVAGALFAGIRLSSAMDPVHTGNVHARQEMVVAERQSVETKLALYPVHGLELQHIVTLSAQLRDRHVGPDSVMAYVAQGMDQTPGLALSEVRWRRLTPAQHELWSTVNLSVQDAQTESVVGTPPPVGGDGFTINPSQTPPEAKSPVVVEMLGHLTDQPNLEDANQRVLDLKRALELHTGNPVHVVKLPYDPEPSQGFMRQFSRNARAPSKESGRFALRFLVHTVAPSAP